MTPSHTLRERLYREDDPVVHSLVRKSLWLYCFTVLMIPMGYAGRVLLSTVLPIEDIGIIYSLLGFFTIVSLWSDFGLTVSLQYFFPKFWVSGEYDRTKTAIFLTAFVQIGMNLLLSCLLLACGGWLETSYFGYPWVRGYLHIGIVYFIGMTIFSIATTLFSTFHDTFLAQTSTFLQSGINLALIFTLFLLGYTGVGGYLAVWAVGIWSGLIFAYTFLYVRYGYVFRKGRFRLGSLPLRTYFVYSLTTLVASQGWVLLGQIDQQMVMYFLGPREAGLYANFLSLNGLYVSISGAFLAFLFPLANALVAKGANDELVTVFVTAYRFLITGALVFGGFAAALGPAIATVVFGDRFVHSGELLRYASPFVCLNVLVFINFSFLSSLGRVRNNLIVILLAVTANVLGNIVLVPMFGSIGAIAMTVVSMIGMAGGTLWYVTREGYAFPWVLPFILRNVTLVFVLSVWLFSMSDIILTLASDRWRGLLVILGFGAIYLACFALMNYREVTAVRRIFASPSPVIPAQARISSEQSEI